jgi:hypothetical protein
MNLVNVKCPVCKQRGQLDRAELVIHHECPNCRQMVRLIPENDTTRRIKFALAAIPLVLVILWALDIILSKLS